MKVIQFMILGAAALLLGACAKTPSSIAPVAVSGSEYASLQCNQLRNEYTQVSAQLSEAEGKQRGAVAADAAGVFLVLIPPSALMGDHEADVARYKGEKIAIERQIEQRNC